MRDGDDDADLGGWVPGFQSVASHPIFHFRQRHQASPPRPIGLFPYWASLTNRYPGVIVIVRNLGHVLRGQRAYVEATGQFFNPDPKTVPLFKSVCATRKVGGALASYEMKNMSWQKVCQVSV